jgi:hypothetical protein
LLIKFIDLLWFTSQSNLLFIMIWLLRIST